MSIIAASIPSETFGEEKTPKRPKTRNRTLITPEGLSIPIVVASRIARLGALIIDFAILYLGLLIFVLLMQWLLGGLIESIGDAADEAISGAGEFLFIVIIIALFLARYGYFLAFELGPRGATWGKRAVGIRVAARDGGRLTPEAVIARNLIRDIEIFMPLVFLMVAPSGQAGGFGFVQSLGTKGTDATVKAAGEQVVVHAENVEID